MAPSVSSIGSDEAEPSYLEGGMMFCLLLGKVRMINATSQSEKV